ncbi:MAG: cell surface protein SprA [Cytophagaceae bacterium]|nr:cell surface protein SprA [Cytophagaceae bacterium]
MRRFVTYSLIAVLSTALFAVAGADDYAPAGHYVYGDAFAFSADTLDDIESVMEPSDIIPPITTPVEPKAKESPRGIALPNPDNQKYEATYDPQTGLVTLYQRIGGISVKLPYTMTLEQYNNLEMRQSMQRYWDLNNGEEEGAKNEFGSWRIGGQAFESIFGSNVINVRPQGIAEVSLGVKNTKIDNPTLEERDRNFTTFDFKPKIQVNVRGEIGERLKLGINYNTEATFEFDNQINLEFAGQEDDILKKVEAGNVSMPLPGTLITGSQSLFGLKTEMQFGKLTVTSIFSQQKGQTQTMDIQGGAQTQEFDVSIDDYDRNRHFFLSHEFRQRYNNALKSLPIINSPFTITKVEVWVTNKSNNFETARNIVAFTDLGENIADFMSNKGWLNGNYQYPSNGSNSLYNKITTDYSNIRDINSVTGTLQGSNLRPTYDYEKLENARMLSPTEYTLNDKLGYISLTTALNSDEILAVAYELTYNGERFQVGEFSNTGPEAPQTLILRTLKGTSSSPNLKTWKLMMKNVYAIGAYQVSAEDFNFNVVYMNDSTGSYINYFPEGKTAEEGGLNGKLFLSIMGLDNLNRQSNPYPDGAFDFVSGVTINTAQGRIIFPVLEPFGQHLQDMIMATTEDGNEETGTKGALIKKFVYKELYDSTLTNAVEQAEKNKFRLTGNYKSSVSSEISLGAFNVPRGSVVVTAGGLKLTENVDYTVDYTGGRISIINQGLMQSGTPIQVSLESQSMFNLQTKTLIGSHFDYRFNDNFNVGATIMHLSERPMTQKVNYGDEPISNTIWGLNTAFTTESNGLTNLIDKLPLIQTKTPSSISFDGEFAHLIPGHPKVISKEGSSYVDDFEGTKIPIDMKYFTSWRLSGTPRFFIESESQGLDYGYNRAKLAWYTIDPLFVRKNSSLTPSHIKDDDVQQSNHYVREVYQREIYPERDNPTGEPTNIAVLNLAYYPAERGPYNFDPNNVDSNGQFKNPKDRWGGMMRKMETVDFEAANINQIEFWLMDPFIYNPDHKGGDLYINIGDVSEDILRDSRKFFEQGLPGPNEPFDMDTTIWGFIPRTQSLVNAFSTDAATRLAQDVGLNGMNSENERTFVHYRGYLSAMESLRNQGLITEEAYNRILQDPASDDFHYYRGDDLDQARAGIHDRYKHYNNPEGNSRPTEGAYSTAATTIPDSEDINGDNTLSENESYYQYKITLAPGMDLTHPYITQVKPAEVTLRNGNTETINWYQFTIPLGAPDEVQGEMQDLSSVRFMRMFLHNFEDTTILRFATLDLIRADWREYTQSTVEADETPNVTVNENTNFEISAVNIEEHANRKPVNYVLPPNVSRVINSASPSANLLNEQALSLKITELGRGDSREVYKTTNYDMRQYRRIKMEVHAEALEDYPDLRDGEVEIFLRLGTDFKSNYYEYSTPLKLTPWNVGVERYNNDNTSHRYIVWPQENMLDIPLELFQNIKLKRNDEKRRDGSNVSNMMVYMGYDPDKPNNRVKIKGNPNLGNVRSIMIGVRNRTGEMKSVEVWVNELRLSDFDEEGGWAATGRMSVKLADLGTVSLAGTVSTVGFGSIDKGVSERSQEDFYQYDVATNLELGKLLGPESRLSVPMYVGISEEVATPKYSPLDPDIEMKTILENTDSKHERDSIKQIAQDVVKRKSFNLTNVRLQPKSPDVKFYDVSNLSATYSYNETTQTNVNTEYLTDKNYRGILAYNFMNRPTTFEPFKGVKSKHLALIRDFNLTPMPTQLGYRWEVSRNYRDEQLRNINNPDYKIPLSVDKDFYWNRYFDLSYNFTKSLRFDFRSSTYAIIYEPQGAVNKDLFKDEYELWKDSVMRNIMSFGRVADYQHTVNASYTVPVNKLPLLDWVSSTVNYSATYAWQMAPVTRDNEYDWGNTIRNTNNMQGTGTLNFTTLYGKSEYLKALDRPATAQKKTGESVRFSQNNIKLVKDTAFTINHNLQTTTVTVRVFNRSGQAVKGTHNVVDANTVTFTAQENNENARVMITGTKPPPAVSPFKIAMEYGARLLTSVKNINVTLSQNNATVLPGYKPESKFLGSNNNLTEPGLPFILGWQARDFAEQASRKGWITKDTTLNNAYTMSRNDDFTIRATLEPIKGFRIELNGNRRASVNISEYYFYAAGANPEIDARTAFNTVEQGNFSMTYNIFATSFKKVAKTGLFESEAFDRFIDNRKIISQRLGMERAGEHDPVGGGRYASGGEIADGYGLTSQEVMIPAFLAAYSGKQASSIFLDAMPSLKQLQPNWRITYDGLGKIKALQKYIKAFEIAHAYRSTYSVSSFQTNLDWIDNGNGFGFEKDATGNFIPKQQISGVVISEEYSPLLQFNITWVNSLSTRAEYKKGRSLNLSLSNNQLIENYTGEWVIGVGYRFDKMDMFFGSREGKRPMSSDLNLRLDIGLRDNFSIIRKIEEGVNQITAGQKTVTWKVTADYVLSDTFNVQLYYDRQGNAPYISTGYPITNSNFGVSFRLSLAQ